MLVHLSHCRRNSLSPVLSIVTSYSQRNCVPHLKFPSLLLRAAPQALVNKRLQELWDIAILLTQSLDRSVLIVNMLLIVISYVLTDASDRLSPL